MSQGIVGGTPQGSSVQVIGQDKNLTEAIRIAGQNRGSEVVVGYVDAADAANPDAAIQYAVLDVGPALQDGRGSKTARATFDPSALSFAPGARIVSAVVVADQREGNVDRNYLGRVQFFDVDPAIQTETVLALAEAAASRIGDPSRNRQVGGFTTTRHNVDWVSMVHQNRSTVLSQISATLGTLESTISDKQQALQSAITEGRTADAETLQGELTRLRGQRDELTTFQGIIRIDMLTDAKGTTVVPGMQARNGDPVRAGAWRTDAGARQAVSVLVEQRAVLQGQLQAIADPEQQGRIERQIAALDSAIQGVSFKTSDFVRSQGLIDRRLDALGTICGKVSDATRELKAMQRAIKDGKAPDRARADELRKELIAEFQRQIPVYRAAGGASEAVVFLETQITELEKLPAGNVGGLLTRINEMQAGLLKQISGMAARIEKVMPREAKAMRDIATGVDSFGNAYTTIKKAAETYESFTRKLGDSLGGQGFRLPQGTIDRLSDAMDWDPIEGGRSPFTTNQFIVGQYVETSREIRAYVGIDEPDWYAVGAKACNQVGGELAKIMTIETALATFANSDGTIANDIRAARAILEVIDGDALGQGAAVVGALGSDFINALRESISSLSLSPLERMSDRLPGISTAVREIRQGFVEGNVKIAENVLTARRIFFEAEFAGEDGVAALRTYARAHPAFDPEGYMTDAFRSIQQARSKVEAGDIEGARSLMLRANASIAMQEQSTFLQTANTFGNRSMRLVLDNAGSSSSLNLERADGQGTMSYQLVDNWTRLHVRMGMNYVSRQDFERNQRGAEDGSLYFKLTIKPNQRLEVEPGMNLRPDQTFRDDQGRTCVKPGVTLYMQLPPDAPNGTAGRLFIEASRGGDIGASMLVRPEAPSGPAYTYNADDSLGDLAGDALEAAWDFVSAPVAEVFEGSDDDRRPVRAQPQSIAVNGGGRPGDSTRTGGTQPLTARTP